jgi:hypothetical protein
MSGCPTCGTPDYAHDQSGREGLDVPAIPAEVIERGAMVLRERTVCNIGEARDIAENIFIAMRGACS